MKKWIKRSLTRAFGRAAFRDRMLADLYVAVRQETYSNLVIERAQKLAYTYDDSYEVGQCIGAMLDYIADGEMPHSAIAMSNDLLRVVHRGPVFDAIMSRAGHLHHCNSMANNIKKQTAIILNGMRLNDDRSMAGIIQMYIYENDIPRRQIAVYPRPVKVTPDEFQKHMKL